MKSLASWRSWSILLLILIALIAFSRCSPAEEKTQSTQAPAPLPTPVEDELTTSAETAEPATVVAESDSPKAKPKPELPVAETKKATPPTRKSAKPTPTVSDEPVSDEGLVEGDFNGDGIPDTILPIVTFGKPSCVELAERFVFQVEVNLSGGDNYWIPPYERDGWEMRVRRGKMWFKYPETVGRQVGELRIPIYRIRSVEEKSWTYFDVITFPKPRNVSYPLSDEIKYGGKLEVPPFRIFTEDSTPTGKFSYPDDFYFSLCKK